MRLMSNNQWYCDVNTPYWREKGLDCSAEVREKGFARFYKETLPDVIGLQETSRVMLEWLMRDLQAEGLRYAAVWGRDTPILYRPDRLELADSDFLIFPENIPGTEGCFNNQDTKSCCAAVFRCKENGKMFGFMTAHLWYMSDDPASKKYRPGSGKARLWQIGTAMARLDAMMREYDAPRILVGDLNAPYDSEPLRAAEAAGFTHAYHAAAEYRDETDGRIPLGPETIGEYAPSTFDRAIDHILVRNMPKGSVRRFERAVPDYYMRLSDHAPMWIDAEL